MRRLLRKKMANPFRKYYSRSADKILDQSTSRVLKIILFCLIFISTFYLVRSYTVQIDSFEENELSKLETIVKTAAKSLDGNAHEILCKVYPEKDAIKTIDQDSVYLDFSLRLKGIQNVLNLPTALYTMVYMPKRKEFDYIIFSDTVFWRHSWKMYHEEHVKFYKTGHRIRPYTDENGTWLSAFAPIKNRNGKVVAILQADSRFNEFIDNAKKDILIKTIISFCVIGLISILLSIFIRKIVRKEKQVANELAKQKEIIEEKQKEVLDSIHYAKRIQLALLPSKKYIQKTVERLKNR